VLADSPRGPGVFAFSRNYQGTRAVALFNTSDQPIVAVVNTGLPAGEKLTVAIASGVTGLTQLVVDAGGKLTVELPGDGAVVALDTGSTTSVPAPSVTLAVTAPAAAQVVSGDLQLAGTASPAPQRLEVVLDGNVSPVAVALGAGGAWTATVPAGALGNGESDHTVAVNAPVEGVLSPSVAFHASESLPTTTASVNDSAGDATGPTLAYSPPTDPSYGTQMDITGITATGVGGALTVSVTMSQVTNTWVPQNGFDHVCFHVFIGLPGQAGGALALPHLQENAPNGMLWNRVAFVGGWHASLYSSDGATPSSYGTPIPHPPAVSVNGNVITFAFAPAALGNLPTLSGAQIYVTTWDCEGTQDLLKRLRTNAAATIFGGGDGTVDPLIMDDAQVVVLP